MTYETKMPLVKPGGIFYFLKQVNNSVLPGNNQLFLFFQF